MNKEKLINIIIFIVLFTFLMGFAYIKLYMQIQARASYAKIEAMTPQAIERNRINKIMKKALQ